MAHENPFRFGKEVSGCRFYDRAETAAEIRQKLIDGASNLVSFAPRCCGKASLVVKVLKVGFFDSGIGGTCILKAFEKLCPGVETVYIADSANCPYGNKPAEEIRRLSEANVKKLLKAGCSMIVVACNTATAAAIDYLRAKYKDVPFVGIEPAIKPAALRSKTGVVGVLATAGTFNGRLYNETKARFAKNTTVLAVVADEFVTIVEQTVGRGRTPVGPRIESAVRARIEPLLKAGADKIVLGCTHFPHLKPIIEQVCAGRAEVIDPSEAVARQAKRILKERGWLNTVPSASSRTAG